MTLTLSVLFYRSPNHQILVALPNRPLRSLAVTAKPPVTVPVTSSDTDNPDVKGVPRWIYEKDFMRLSHPLDDDQMAGYRGQDSDLVGRWPATGNIEVDSGVADRPHVVIGPNSVFWTTFGGHINKQQGVKARRQRLRRKCGNLRRSLCREQLKTAVTTKERRGTKDEAMKLGSRMK